MKNKKPVWLYLLLPALLSCEIDIAQTSVREEPHHKLVLENEYVRLYDGQVKEHDTTIAHVHAANTVVVFLSKSIFGLQNIGEKPAVLNVSPGNLIYRNFGDKPVNHIVWNLGGGMLHFMLVELLRQHRGNNTCSVISEPGIKFEWQQELVLAYSINIFKGIQCHIPQSNCAYLLIDVSGSVTTTSSSGKSNLQTNDFIFFRTQSDITIRGNKESAQCVLLELK